MSCFRRIPALFQPEVQSAAIPAPLLIVAAHVLFLEKIYEQIENVYLFNLPALPCWRRGVSWPPRGRPPLKRVLRARGISIIEDTASGFESRFPDDHLIEVPQDQSERSNKIL